MRASWSGACSLRAIRTPRLALAMALTRVIASSDMSSAVQDT